MSDAVGEALQRLYRPASAAVPGLGLRATLSAALSALAAFSVSLPVTLWLSGCGPSPDAGAGATQSTAAPPVEVGVVVVAPGTVGLLTELPGRTEASRVAQVRARAAGILNRQLFREGSDVKAGQVLFRIDDAPYRAALAGAQAALARAEANLMQAQAQAERYKPLVQANAVSQQEYVSATASFKQAEADVAAAHAAVQVAQINLGYATVVSPLSGRIGRALVTEGALVGQGDATQLALVQQIDPLYVNFTQPAAEVLRLRAAIAQGQLRRAAGIEAAAVRVLLEDGSVYPLPGKLLFSDLSVDAGTGQIMLRAEVPNPKGMLLPGLYVRVRLEQAQAPGAMRLPQQAVQLSNQGSTVLVVGADGKVATRPVTLGQAQGGQAVVLEGLAAGEQVVVDGFQKVRPNVIVKPVPWRAAVVVGGAPAEHPAMTAATATGAASAMPAASAVSAALAASVKPPAPAASR